MENTTKILGIVSLYPQGDYNSTTQYQQLSLVRYNGASYVAKKSSLGQIPSEQSDYWMLLVQDGGGVDLSEYQKKTDDGLKTISKEVVGAINEVNNLADKALGDIADLNIENLIDENGNNTGSITTVKDEDKNTGKGKFCAVFGSRNQMDTDNSLLVGQDNVAKPVEGQEANSAFVAGGNGNIVVGNLVSAIGHQLRINIEEATHNDWKPKLGIGTFNKDVKEAALIVGVGYDESNRANGLVVYYDGHVEVQTQGTTENSVVIKKQLDKKLDKKTANDNIYTRAYCFNQNEQTERFICTGEESAGIFVGALAAYDSNVCLRQNATPTLNNQVANKSYVDSAINTAVKSTIDTDLTSTTAWLMLLKNTRYVRGTLTELTLNFSTEGTFTDGDEIVIEFISGSTATTVTRDTTNAIYNFSTVGANKFVELNAEYKASIGKWVVLSAETPYTAS